MREDNLNDGTVKTFLVLILLAANIALAVFAPSASKLGREEHAQRSTTPQNESYVARP